MKLLLVHGRAQGGRRPAEIETEWLAAWDRGLAKSGLSRPPGLEVALPFYGDELDRFAREFDVPPPADLAAKGAALDAGYLSFSAGLAEELRARTPISDTDVRAEMATEFGPARATAKGPENWEWVQSVIRLLDRRFPDATRSFFSTFLRDVFLYTQRRSVRRTIDEIVRQGLSAGTRAVVGHSLGSVVAYNVLCAADTARAERPRYVSVGSPLGIRGVRDSLATPLENPAAVRGWSNHYDPRDVVALVALDAANFGVDPAIEGYGDLRNPTGNHHGISGYLDDARLARRVYEALTGP